jgi:hypothetical protein
MQNSDAKARAIKMPQTSPSATVAIVSFRRFGFATAFADLISRAHVTQTSTMGLDWIFYNRIVTNMEPSGGYGKIRFGLGRECSQALAQRIQEMLDLKGKQNKLASARLSKNMLVDGGVGQMLQILRYKRRKSGYVSEIAVAIHS